MMKDDYITTAQLDKTKSKSKTFKKHDDSGAESSE